MLGHQQLLQQQHQQHHNQHSLQHQHPHPLQHPCPIQHQQQQQHPHLQPAQYQQQQESHQDFNKPASGKKLSHPPPPPPPLSSSSTSSIVTVSAINIKSSSASASLPPAYPYSNHSVGPVSTASLPSVSSSSNTLASAAGDASTGTGENFVPNIKKAKYSTSLDPRGFIPVFEYDLYGHPIMWDQENLYVHFTGIWKALGKTKADIVKIIDGNPILETIIRKVRGGFLKIQGTWMPHQEAYDLAKKTCYKLRHELVPVFGAGFVNDCIPPDTPRFGSIHLTVVRRRASECVVGQRQAVIGAQQLRLQQTHIHPSLKRRYSSNDVSRLSRFNQSGGPPTASQLSSTSFLLNRNKDYPRDDSVDGDQEDDLDLDLDEEDSSASQARKANDLNRKQRFHRMGRFNSMGDNEDDDDDDDDRLLDGSTADEEEHRSLSGSYDDDDIDVDGESCFSEQDDPMYGLARLDLSRRNSSPMPLSTAYALSAGMGIKSTTVRARRGRPPTRSPMPVANRIAANYVAYNNYVSSNTQAAQGLGRNSGSTRIQKQQLRQQQKLQNQLQQQQQQQQQQFQQQQHHPFQLQPMSMQQQPQHSMQPSQLSPDQEHSNYQLQQQQQQQQSASSSPGLSHQELVEFFKAGQALQRMSQDDGSRPWKHDGGRMILPKKIVLGEQVFQCVGGEYKCVPEPNNTASSKAPGEDDGWSR